MKNRAFTFIETLVVISVLGIVFPLLFSTFFVILRQQLKINRLTDVKRQGDSIFRILEETIKNNGYTIYNDAGDEVCGASGVNPSYSTMGDPFNLVFRDQFNSEFVLAYNGSSELTLINNQDPSSPAPTFAFAAGNLNSGKVIVRNMTISCIRDKAFSSPLISIGFTVCYDQAGECDMAKPENVASLDYQTNIKFRSYPTQ